MHNRYDLYSICIVCHNRVVAWFVEIGDEFESEFTELPEDVRTEILAHARLL